jgi:hypothetical protein
MSTSNKLLFGLCLVVAACSSMAATVAVGSPYGPTQWQAANDAATAGDTLLGPSSASLTWSSGFNVTKALTIDLNGSTITASATVNTGFIQILNLTTTSLVRITGGTLDMVNHTASRCGINMSGSDLTNLRIDHMTFRYGYVQINCYGAKGVIDNNTFYNPLKGIDFSAGSVTQANASWVSMAAGTSDALFIETNTFTYDGSYPSGATQESIGTENGGKLVVRYNTWASTSIAGGIDMMPVMTHGSAAGGVANGYWQQGTGARRGQSVFEMYNNTITGARVDFLCIVRGSANLIHDNTLDCTVNNPRVMLREEEGEDTQWVPLRTAWPAEDQVHNTFIWSNTLRKSGVTVGSYVEVFPDSSATFIQLNRDYWLTAPQSSGGSESFTAANGASGTNPTDGSPYATLGTMVFTSSGANAYFGYTPYTYPHPLTAGGSGGSTSAAPTQKGVSHRGGVRIK